MTNDPTSLPDDVLGHPPEISVGPTSNAAPDSQLGDELEKPKKRKTDKPSTEIPSRFESPKTKSDQADDQLVNQTKQQIRVPVSYTHLTLPTTPYV